MGIRDRPVFADLGAEPGVVASLQELGFAEPKFGHGRIISKPPHSPQLYWCAARTAVGQLQPRTTAVGVRHRDGRLWNDPASSTAAAMPVFLMFYPVSYPHLTMPPTKPADNTVVT